LAANEYDWFDLSVVHGERIPIARTAKAYAKLATARPKPQSVESEASGSAGLFQ